MKTKISKVVIIFKSGVVKTYYDVIGVENRKFNNDMFLTIDYMIYGSTRTLEFYRLDDIGSWTIDKVESKEEVND